MNKESTAVLLRMFIGENDKCEGKTLYEYIVTYLKEKKYAGVTVLRGITGFGHSMKIHTANLIELSTDEPIIIEIVDNTEKIEAFKAAYAEWHVSGNALVTQEKVTIVQYGPHSKNIEY